jgi:hypothetical protein
VIENAAVVKDFCSQAVNALPLWLFEKEGGVHRNSQSCHGGVTHENAGAGGAP